MHKIAVKPYLLLDQATDAFGVGMMANLQLSISLPASAHFRSDAKVTIKKHKKKSHFSSLSFQM